MSVDLQLLARVEDLRIPFRDATAPRDWKDWYHYLFLDLALGVRVLVNVTFTGRPGQGQVTLVFLVSLPAEALPDVASDQPLATLGTAAALDWEADTVRRLPFRVQAPGLRLEIDGARTVLAVHDERARLALQFDGRAEASPLLVTEASPFGGGFIGWGILPFLAGRGALTVCGYAFPITPSWYGYHDRNFGRFRWGEDIGWEWFVVSASDADGVPLTLILECRTNRDHTDRGLPFLYLYVGQVLRKIFLGPALHIVWSWSPGPERPARLPGTMATLFRDRTLRLPRTLRVEAADERDALVVAITFDAATELVVPDDRARQYTFIEELTGRAQLHASLAGEPRDADGLAYAEYVH